MNSLVILITVCLTGNLIAQSTVVRTSEQSKNVVLGEHDLDPVFFSPIDPVSCPKFTLETSKGEVEKFFADMTTEEINQLLPLEQSIVSIKKVQRNGGLSFSTATVSAEKGSYTVYLDYVKYRDERSNKGDRVRLGVGVRIQADIVTTSAGIDLGSIFAIGLAAKSNKLTGSVQVLKIGVDSAKISALMPPPRDLSDDSLLNALQCATTVHALLFDSTTKLTPHVIAVGKPIEIDLSTK